MQARYYDPNIGRFLSIDPVTFMSSGGNLGYFNRYAYTFNNPVNFIDPNGMQVEVELKGHRIEQTNLAGHALTQITDTETGQTATLEGGPTDTGGDVGNSASESINSQAGHEDALLQGEVSPSEVTSESRGREIETIDSTTVDESFDAVVQKAQDFVNGVNEQNQNYDALSNSSNTLATRGYIAITGKVPTNNGARAYPGGTFMPKCTSCP